MYNVLYADFPGGCKGVTVTPHSWQWDKGQILRVQGLPVGTGTQVHFNIDGQTLTAVGGSTDGVLRVYIPDDVFTEAGTIPVYIYLSEDDATAETLYTATLTIRERSKPEDYSEPTEAQETLFQAAIDAVAAAQVKADDAAALSESWAVGGTGTRAGEDYDNSKFYAELAKQQAAESGFVYFEIRYPGYLYIVRSDNLDDDIDFAINESGELEVELL